MWWYYSTVFRIHCCYWEVCFIPVAIPLWMKSYLCKFLSSSFCFGYSEDLLSCGNSWVSFVNKAGIPEICVLKTLLRVCCMPKFENPCYTALKVYYVGSPVIWGHHTGLCRKIENDAKGTPADSTPGCFMFTSKIFNVSLKRYMTLRSMQYCLYICVLNLHKQYCLILFLTFFT